MVDEARGKIAAAIDLLRAANCELEDERLEADEARGLMRDYGRAESLVAYGLTKLGATVRDAEAVAKATGTSVGKAKQRLATGEALQSATKTRDAFRSGRISADQAAEIARAEAVAPHSAGDLLKTAQGASFQVLRDEARKIVLEAEQHRDLGARQRKARHARASRDEIGMVDIHLKLQPHVGTPLVNRAEAEATRLYRAARKKAAKGKTDEGSGELEPFPCYLADAYAAMLAGNSVKARSKRPELVVLVSHTVAKRGWSDVRDGEVCKKAMCSPPSSFLPPAQDRSLRRLPPQVARDIADDAFLNGVFYDGTDLRHFKRYNRNIPVEMRVALELGTPPHFDGVKCVECGDRLHPESDHEHPYIAGGPTSYRNLPWRCWPCHLKKTARDRVAGKLKPRAGPVVSMAG